MIQRYDQIVSDISKTKKQVHPRLICVSKHAHPDAIEQLYHQRKVNTFGENRLKDMQRKAYHLRHLKDLKWIYLGALSSRIIRPVVEVADEIHSVSRVKEIHAIIQAIQTIKTKNHLIKPMPVLLQVHCGEPQKRGFLKADLKHLFSTRAGPHPDIALSGILAMPPLIHSLHFYHTNLISMMYDDMAHLKDQLGCQRLSLGMSMDWRAGVMVGATDIRIGSDIFCPQNLKHHDPIQPSPPNHSPS